jgi:UDP-N-acetylglucosamine 2-epimerase (non-hydrolysing)
VFVDTPMLRYPLWQSLQLVPKDHWHYADECLEFMKQNQDLYDVTSKVLMEMKPVLTDYKPDLVLVHGDTTTSMATALAAYYQHIPIAHIEAGLRTNNIYSPWPEEINRQITARIATYHFAPTLISKQNLIKENINENNIIITGNTVIDSLLYIVNAIKSSNLLQNELQNELLGLGYDTDRLTSRKMVLITGHRRENFGKGFLDIFNAIKILATKHTDVDFVYPMHLNPNVRNSMQEIFGESLLKNVFFMEPLEYLPFVYMMDKCNFILTDSGGIQEEAPSLGKPVLVMRETTERPEAVIAGTVELVGTDVDAITYKSTKLILEEQFYLKMSKSINPYGDGKASDRIVSFLNDKFE